MKASILAIMSEVKYTCQGVESIAISYTHAITVFAITATKFSMGRLLCRISQHCYNNAILVPVKTETVLNIGMCTVYHGNETVQITLNVWVLRSLYSLS